MADPFHPSPAPVTPRATHTAAINNPRGCHIHPSIPPLSTLDPPTPSRPFAGGFMGRPITWLEYQAKSQLRDDKIFEEFKAVLQGATNIVTFEWKANKCQGKFVPIP